MKVFNCLSFSTIYSDSVDRQLASAQPNIQKILSFSSITPPTDYIMEKSVGSMSVIFNGTSERRNNRMPFQEIGDSKIKNKEVQPEKHDIKRLSQQSSTPNRKLHRDIKIWVNYPQF